MKSRTCRYSIIIGQNARLMKRLSSVLLLFALESRLAQQQRPAQKKRDQKKKRGLPRSIPFRFTMVRMSVWIYMALEASCWEATS